MSHYKLIDNEKLMQYEYHTEHGTALIEYSKPTSDEILLTHVETPESLQGKGVGRMLVEDCLKDIDRQQLKLTPVCPFVVWYINRHPEWKRLTD